MIRWMPCSILVRYRTAAYRDYAPAGSADHRASGRTAAYRCHATARARTDPCLPDGDHPTCSQIPLADRRRKLAFRRGFNGRADRNQFILLAKIGFRAGLLTVHKAAYLGGGPSWSPFSPWLWYQASTEVRVSGSDWGRLREGCGVQLATMTRSNLRPEASTA